MRFQREGHSELDNRVRLNTKPGECIRSSLAEMYARKKPIPISEYIERRDVPLCCFANQIWYYRGYYSINSSLVPEPVSRTRRYVIATGVHFLRNMPD